MANASTKRRKSKGVHKRPLWEPSRRTKVVLLFCLIALFAVIRFRLRSMPLERDEGEYAYAGQLILQGVPPYKLAYNMKLPGTYAAYALIMAVLGQTPAGIHIGLLLVNSLTMVLVYVLAAQLFGSMAGLVSAATYGALSTSPSVFGLQAHATQFVVFPTVLGLIVLLRAIQPRRLWLFFFSGVLFGLAFLMKQPGVFFAGFAVVYVIRSQWGHDSWQDIAASVGALLGGIALPYALTCLILWKAGVFGNFWFWTVSYARQYGGILSWKDGLDNLRGVFPGVLKNSVAIWLLAAAGITTFWWNAEACRHRFFTLSFLVFSFLAVCPGFYFREHYFVLLLPAVSLLAGVAVYAVTAWLSSRTDSVFLLMLPALVFLGAFVLSLLVQKAFFFEMDPVSASLSIYGAEQPFEQAIAIGDYVRTHSAPDARIAVLGSEPEIYFYAQRRSATGYIYMYPLMEPQAYAKKMQDEMIAEVEAARPEFIALVRFPLSWIRGPLSSDHLLNWMTEYIPDRYDSVGVAELKSTGVTEYRWDEEARSYNTDSPYVIFLFRRHT